MIAMKFGWLALEGLFLAFFACFGSSAALALAIVLILIPLCSLPLNLYIRKKLTVKINAASNIRKGESGRFSIVLENPTALPVLRVRCSVRVENQLNREKRDITVVTWMPPKRQQKTLLDTGSDYCGRLRIAAAQVILYDCFGLIGVPSRTKAAAHMTVQPNTFEASVSLLLMPECMDDSEMYSQERPGSDLTETYQIREYVPGDSPRQIHWKLSSKFDKLIVRDPALPITRNVLVFWERTGESGNPEMIDAQAEAVVSLCRCLLDQSVPFAVGWNDTDRNLCILHEIHEMDDLVGIVPRLMRAAGARDGISGAGLLLQTSAPASCAHVVYLAEEPQREVMDLQRFGHVTMLLCGETAVDGAIRFDPEHYREHYHKLNCKGGGSLDPENEKGNVAAPAGAATT